MEAAVFHGEGDVRIEDVPDPEIEEPTDAIVRITHTAICGSDLWFYRGQRDYETPGRVGHEPMGIVEAVGDDVTSVRPGDRVLSPFSISCGECEYCRKGLYTSCVEDESWGGEHDGAQGEQVRVPFADGTLVRIPERYSDDEDVLKSLLPLTDVMCTGHHAAVSAGVSAGDTAVVVGAGNVGLNAVQGAAHAGAGQIVAVDPVASKRDTAETFGASHTVDPTTTDVAETVATLTDGTGADATIFCVGVGDGDLIGDAYDTLGPRGELVVTATAPDDSIAVNPVDLITTEKEIKGCLYGGASPRRTASRLIDAYLDDRYLLDELVTSQYDLGEINEAYDALLDGEDIHSVISVSTGD